MRKGVISRSGTQPVEGGARQAVASMPSFGRERLRKAVHVRVARPLRVGALAVGDGMLTAASCAPAKTLAALSGLEAPEVETATELFAVFAVDVDGELLTLVSDRE